MGQMLDTIALVGNTHKDTCNGCPYVYRITPRFNYIFYYRNQIRKARCVYMSKKKKLCKVVLLVLEAVLVAAAKSGDDQKKV